MTKTTTVVTAVLATSLLAYGLWFAIAFNINLHCTQYTSLRLALFDMEPHVEEAIEGGPPLVYQRGAAVPLRAYFGGTLLAFLFVPGGTAFFTIAGKLAYRRWRFAVLGVGAILLLNSLLPNAIVGERLSFLGWFALVTAVIPLTLLAVLLRRTR